MRVLISERRMLNSLCVNQLRCDFKLHDLAFTRLKTDLLKALEFAYRAGCATDYILKIHLNYLLAGHLACVLQKKLPRCRSSEQNSCVVVMPKGRSSICQTSCNLPPVETIFRTQIIPYFFFLRSRQDVDRCFRIS